MNISVIDSSKLSNDDFYYSDTSLRYASQNDGRLAKVMKRLIDQNTDVHLFEKQNPPYSMGFSTLSFASDCLETVHKALQRFIHVNRWLNENNCTPLMQASE